MGYQAMKILRSRTFGILSLAARSKKRTSALTRANQRLILENQRLALENQHLKDELQRDRLTKLWNRLGLRLRWEESAYRGVLVIDVDNFKQVNDTYGHDVGDEALIIITKHLKALAIGARTGGDEFVALVRDENPALVAERIRAAINQPVTIAGEPITLSVSVGVYLVQPGDTLPDALRRADQATYYSKHHGRNLVTLWKKEVENGFTNRNRRNARIR